MPFVNLSLRPAGAIHQAASEASGWSLRGELNPFLQLGKLSYCQYTTKTWSNIGDSNPFLQFGKLWYYLCTNNAWRKRRELNAQECYLYSLAGSLACLCKRFLKYLDTILAVSKYASLGTVFKLFPILFMERVTALTKNNHTVIGAVMVCFCKPFPKGTRKFSSFGFVFHVPSMASKPSSSMYPSGYVIGP